MQITVHECIINIKVQAWNGEKLKKVSKNLGEFPRLETTPFRFIISLTPETNIVGSVLIETTY
jgi:hypothetical protein